MTHLFFHEKRAEILAKHQKELAKFDASEAEYNIVYDILMDIKADYPEIYIYQGQTYASINIPRSMSRLDFYKWLDYLEDEYLTDYNMVRNDVRGSEVIADYIHKDTDGIIMLRFSISQCDIVEKVVKEIKYVTDCHWE